MNLIAKVFFGVVSIFGVVVVSRRLLRRSPAPPRDGRTFRHASPGAFHTWKWSELPDTLFESELWETRKSDVDGLAVGEKLTSGVETLTRLT